ncbi:MAG: hypothetical protein F4Z58_06765 [Acidimicrobiaceae bacterium]|nr:hypothetical protein [Acidimicrobiaceae bacterium]MXW75730.1 hypothetical protein [Acidimicrobiaceae bacterium]MYC43051.1 hypothetical protein [Acidimicrobiaceae bacterium]MYD07330.1 hypothetical protein [Acidimicrobiaceae bacterium]MYI57073.1 hypothetical protein [Acidimicrobiaceae bacterium]
MSKPADEAIHYEPDDRCGPLVALGVGIQGVMLVLATIVLIVAVTARAGGQDDSYVAWAVFSALIIAGGLTALQAARFWRLGAGHILIMGPTPNYVAVSVLALAAGGPGLLASLTVAAGIFYLALSMWLPLLRRLLTPIVSGTVMMLIAATVLPIALDRVQDVPESAPTATGPVVALVTLVAVVVLSLRVSGSWRIWSPLIAIGTGCLAAVMFGAVEVSPIGDAAWVGLPDGGFGGLDLTFDADFWSLLPAFVVVALVGTVKNIGDCIAIQQVSWRRPRVTDFRLVQGSLNTNGIGIMLSGLAGTPPTSVYSSSSPSLIHLTGVAARSVGYAIGAFMVVLALLPKVGAALLAIPSPVMGAYLLTAIGVLFVSGMQTLVAGGLDRGKSLTVGIAFSLGIGLDTQTIGADLLGDRWGPLIDNGMLVGAVAAVLMSQFTERTSRRGRARLEVELRMSAVTQIDEFLRGFASRIGWDDAAAQRLCSAGEETLMSLLDQDGGRLSSDSDDSDAASRDNPKLIVVARQSGASVEMEFLAVLEEENLEDRLAHLHEESHSAAGLEDGEISLRLLRHYASSVHHQKFYGLDIVTVQVTAAG